MIISFSFRPISQGTSPSLTLSLSLSVLPSFSLAFSIFVTPPLPFLSLFLTYRLSLYWHILSLVSPCQCTLNDFSASEERDEKGDPSSFPFSCPGICIALSFRCPVRPVSVSNVAVAAEKRREEQICTAYFREVKLE